MIKHTKERKTWSVRFPTNLANIYRSPINMAAFDHFNNRQTSRLNQIFLDDYHILTLADSFLKAQSGFRVCCFRLDGSLEADLPLPGYPWTAKALRPTEVVVTIRWTDSRGPVWLSVDTERGMTEVTKSVPIEPDPYGLAYSKDEGLFVVSHNQEHFLTMLNHDGVCAERIPIRGATYRCMCSYLTLHLPP